ncbi:MAG TPA: hypothetical protein VJ279_08530 [Hanamia sp.]|nr:hypothetical protein [Hanamia sp.]
MLATIQFHYQTGYRVKSQRREAILRLLQVMVYYMDDATGRVGRLLDNGLYEYYTMKKLAKFAGLKFKRAKRAMKAIVRAGYIKVTRQYKMDEETGKYEGRGSRREFLPKFFIDLDISGDLWTKWFSQKNWKREREEKKRTKQDIRRAWSAIGFLKESIGHSIDRAKKPIKRIVGIVKGIPLEDPFPVKEAKIAHEKNLIAKALNLFNLDPSKSVREYLQELKALHPPP